MATFTFNRTASRIIQPKLHLMFEDHTYLEDHIVSRRVWPPRSCDLTPLDKDKCYADKPETTDALKDNIREASGEILCCTQ